MENVENVTMAKVDNNASDYMDPWIVVPLYFGCGLTTIVCKFLSIKHGFNFAPEGRPITWLNIIDQTTQLTGMTVYCGSKIIQYSIGTSVNDIFQTEWACYIEYAAFLTIILNQTLGGLTIVLYRLITLKFTRLAIEKLGVKSLAKLLTLLNWSVLVVLLVTGLRLVSKKTFAPQLEFCRCRHKEMAEIFNTYRGIVDEQHHGSRLTQFAGIMLLMAANLLELLCYVSIFLDRYTFDRRMVGKLKPEVVNQRMKGNTVALSTQVVMFAIEVMFQLLLALRNMLMAGDTQEPEVTVAPFISMQLVVMIATLSVTALISSSELKKHYFLIEL